MPNKKRSPEHDLQTAIFAWANMQAGNCPALKYLFAIPNGGQRHPAVAMRLKAEGVKRGVPDVFLPLPVNNYHGLFMEVKIFPNKCTLEQKEFLNFLDMEGYATIVVYSLEQAILAFNKYFAGGVWETKSL